MPYPEHGISKTGDYTLANIYNLLYSQIYYRKTKKKRNKTSYIFLLCTYLSECQQASAQSNIRHSFSFRDDNKNDNNQTNTHIWWDIRQVKPGNETKEDTKVHFYFLTPPRYSGSKYVTACWVSEWLSSRRWWCADRAFLSAKSFVRRRLILTGAATRRSMRIPDPDFALWEMHLFYPTKTGIWTGMPI